MYPVGSLNRKETGNDQEVQRRKTANGNQCTQIRQPFSNYSTNRSRTNNGKSMAERCRMARLRGIKSRVQFSDNPETIVQQQKNWFSVDFSKSVDHGIPIPIFQTAFCWKNKKRNFSRTKSRVWNSVYTAKTSLFSAFFETEKIFLLKWKGFFSETTVKCPEKRW